MFKEKLSVCLFVGSYDIERQKMLKKVLEFGNVEVFECTEKINGVFSFFKAYVKMYLCHHKLDYDVMIIPWRGLFTYPLGKLISKGPIIFMPTISVYNTLIEDRKKYSPNHPIARIVHFAEKFACKHSDMIISESDAQNQFLIKEYGITKEKCRALVHSADESFFKPLPFKENSEEFNVIFFGTFTPHHGVNVVVDAANILKNEKDIKFILCGDGIMKNKIESQTKEYKLSNVEFTGFLKKPDLISRISDSDVCLGIFGTSGKAHEAITNKVCQVLACQRPLITMDTKAIKEIKLKNYENCVLVESGNPQSLADSILKLKNEKQLRKTIAQNGYKTYCNELSMEKTIEKLRSYLNEVIS